MQHQTPGNTEQSMETRISPLMQPPPPQSIPHREEWDLDQHLSHYGQQLSSDTRCPQSTHFLTLHSRLLESGVVVRLKVIHMWPMFSTGQVHSNLSNTIFDLFLLGTCLCNLHGSPGVNAQGLLTLIYRYRQGAQAASLTCPGSPNQSDGTVRI